MFGMSMIKILANVMSPAARLTIPFRSRWSLPCLAVLLAVGCVGEAEVRAAGTQVAWDGGGGTGDWATEANWASPPPTDAAFSPDFAGTIQLTTTNSTYSGLTRISFLSGAGSFTLNGVGTGSTVALSDRVNNLSTNLQTINFNLSLAATERFDTVAGGTTRINGSISGVGGINVNQAGSGLLILTGSNSNTVRSRSPRAS